MDSDYLDFFVRIGPSCEGGYTLYARCDNREAHGVLRPEPWLEECRPLVADLQKYCVSARKLGPATELPPDLQLTNRARGFGDRLFRSLFSEGVRGQFDIAREKARENGLRLRISTDVEGLADIPWELLHDSQDYLSLSEVSIARCLSQGSSPAKSTAARLRVLVMAACPADAPPLDLEREKAAIDQALRGARVELRWVEGTTEAALEARLREGPWHIFHFIGHGGVEPNQGDGFILLDDGDGKSKPLLAEHLSRMLLDRRQALRLVVLNCCESARGTHQDGTRSNVAAALVAHRIPAVLAMQYPLRDDAAIRLAESFYSSVAVFDPVDAALAWARKAVSRLRRGSVEWATPALYLQSPDGHLFDPQPETPAAPAPESTVGEAAPFCCGNHDPDALFAEFLMENPESRAPLVCLVHGEGTSRTESFVKRLYYERIVGFLESEENLATGSALFKEPEWPEVQSGSAEVQQKILRRFLFDQLNPHYKLPDRSAMALDQLVQSMRHPAVVFHHHLKLSDWERLPQDLLRWYFREYWGELVDKNPTTRFFLFVSIEHPLPQPPGFWQKLMGASQAEKHEARKKRFLQALEALAPPAPGCPFLVLPELGPVDYDDVVRWFKEYPRFQKRRAEVLQKLFPRGEGTETMETVEAELQRIYDDEMQTGRDAK